MDNSLRFKLDLYTISNLAYELACLHVFHLRTFLFASKKTRITDIVGMDNLMTFFTFLTLYGSRFPLFDILLRIMNRVDVLQIRRFV